ncbi:aminotransferase [Streptomyces noursei]|uniref:Aminotransferase n=2 Tax=Streptomyces noursei TaxID=1971 RepID=A0A2N8PPB6_STRNR|nr:aminotransferase class IV family protein [Streptomyces noursei]PNE42859.1 aminotransferase [Streptomyces noursei]
MAEINGNPVTVSELQTLALVNFGHFTSMRMENQAIRGLSLHLDRLQRDCRAVFDTDLDRDEVLDYVRHAVGDEQGVATVRVTVFDPELDMGHPGSDATPHILVTMRLAGAMPPPPLAVRTFEFSRDTPEVKHVGLFSQLRLRRLAQRGGSDDVLFLETDGRISEGGTWNTGFVAEDGTVIWPQAAVLPGVTMQLLQNAYPHKVAPVTLADLPRMRAAFATNASIGVRAISVVNDRLFAVDGPVLSELQQCYVAIEGEHL